LQPGALEMLAALSSSASPRSLLLSRTQTHPHTNTFLSFSYPSSS
jgi:hypothetical protein